MKKKTDWKPLVGCLFVCILFIVLVWAVSYGASFIIHPPTTVTCGGLTMDVFDTCSGRTYHDQLVKNQADYWGTSFLLSFFLVGCIGAVFFNRKKR